MYVPTNGVSLPPSVLLLLQRAERGAHPSRPPPAHPAPPGQLQEPFCCPEARAAAAHAARAADRCSSSRRRAVRAWGGRWRPLSCSGWVWVSYCWGEWPPGRRQFTCYSCSTCSMPCSRGGGYLVYGLTVPGGDGCKQDVCPQAAPPGVLSNLLLVGDLAQEENPTTATCRTKRSCINVPLLARNLARCALTDLPVASSTSRSCTHADLQLTTVPTWTMC
jgi:hypothetical protein